MGADARTIILSSKGLAVWGGSRRLAFMPWKASPRLREASQAARENVELLNGGEGVHWPDVDEDLSLAGIVRHFPAAGR